jgi:hypothetical protein
MGNLNFGEIMYPVMCSWGAVSIGGGGAGSPFFGSRQYALQGSESQMGLDARWDSSPAFIGRCQSSGSLVAGRRCVYISTKLGC